MLGEIASTERVSVMEKRKRRLRRRLASAAGSVDLPFGDINVVVVTDVHSWISGHGRHESALNADYGDIVSWYQNLQEYADFHKKELFFVMNGDFMDGTGLSTVPPNYLTPLLEKMPWDAVNMGNHELYDNARVDWIANNFVPHWNGNYLTSNTLMKNTSKPIGNRYTYLHAKHSNVSILTFGFLFDFVGNCNSTIVAKVEDVVRESWFLGVLAHGNYQAILVLAHMHVTDPLVNVIRTAIRKVVGPSMPIQFVTGHTHIRAYAVLDENAASFEAGRFLDTVGFCSFPIKSSTSNLTQEVLQKGNNTELLFPHVFIDANRKALGKVLHKDSFETSAGISLTDKIHTTQDSLGVLDKVGCARRTYHLARAMSDEFSLWGLYMYDVVPSTLTNHSESILFVQGTGALRYDLMQGDVLTDDLISVCPFNDTIYSIAEDLSGAQIMRVLNITKANAPAPGNDLPDWALSHPEIDPEARYDLWTVNFHRSYIFDLVENVTGLPVPAPRLIVNPKTGDLVTTTGIWHDFVTTNWPCSANPFFSLGSPASTSSGHEETVVDKEEKPLTVAVFIFLVVVGLWFYQRGKQRARMGGYSSLGEAYNSTRKMP